MLSNSRVDTEFLSLILKPNNIKHICIGNCTFSGDESEAKKVIDTLSEKGLEAAMEDGLINIYYSKE